MNDQEYRKIPGTLGERIVYFRKLAGLTQAQLAEKLNISAQAVSKWESGLSCPDIMMLVPLAQIFQISTDVLLGVDKGSTSEFWGLTMAEQLKDEGDQEPFATTGEVMVIEQPVHSLYLDLGAVSAQIMEGERSLVEWSGMSRDYFESRVEHGIWKIRTKQMKDPFHSFKHIFTSEKLKITIPMGASYQDLKICLGAGKIHGSGLRTKSARIEVGAGELRLDNLISLSSDIQCGLGSVSITGDLTGKSKVECGMGEITMCVKQPEQYGYKVSLGMGQVIVGDNRLFGFGEQSSNLQAPTVYEIGCGMGMVQVKFKNNA